MLTLVLLASLGYQVRRCAMGKILDAFHAHGKKAFYQYRLRQFLPEITPWVLQFLICNTSFAYEVSTAIDVELPSISRFEFSRRALNNGL